MSMILMIRKLDSAVLILFAMSATSCASLTSPDLTRRYSEAEFLDGCTTSDGVSLRDKISASISTLPVDQPKLKGVADLPERTAAAYIKGISSKAKNIKDFQDAVNAPIKAASGDSVSRTFARRLIITVSQSGLLPGDRLAFSRVTIEPEINQDNQGNKTPSFSFVSWNTIATEYQVYDLGALKLTQSAESTLGLKGDPAPNEVTEVTASGTYKRSLEESLSLQHRVEMLTPQVNSKSAVLIREGVSNIDLTGNTIFDVLIKLPGGVVVKTLSTKGLYDSRGDFLPPKMASVAIGDVYSTGRSGPIKGKFNIAFDVRRVNYGRGTTYEGDDVASYIHCSPEKDADWNDFEMVDEEASRGDLLQLYVTNGDYLRFRRDPLDDRGEEIFLHGYSEADKLAAWFRAKRVSKIGFYEFGYLKKNKIDGEEKFVPLSGTEFNLLETLSS